MKKSNEESSIFWYIIIGICVVLFIVVISAFVVFANRKEKVIEKTEKGGDVVLNYTKNNSNFQIINASPVTDQVAISSLNDDDYYDFSVDVKLDNANSVQYEISAIKDSSNSTISDNDIKIYLEKENSGSYTKVFGPSNFNPIKEKTSLGSKKGSMVLVGAKKIKSGIDHYRLRIWHSETSLLPSGNYSINIEVNAKAK